MYGNWIPARHDEEGKNSVRILMNFSIPLFASFSHSMLHYTYNHSLLSSMSKVIFVFALIFVLSGCSTAPSASPTTQTQPSATSENTPQEIIPETPTQPESSNAQTYSLEEVSKHSTRDDCWTVVNGVVADVTSAFGKHPGGDDALAKACGKDATQMFESVKKHDPKGYESLQKLQIGTLAQ